MKKETSTTSAINSRRQFVASCLVSPMVLSGCALINKIQTPAVAELQESEFTKLPTDIYEGWSGSTTSTGPQSRVEVIHFCGFLCAPCYQFEKQLAPWVESNFSRISFQRKALSLRKDWTASTRLHYALEIEGLSDRLYDWIFYLAQEKNTKLYESEKIANLVKSLEPSVDEQSFLETFRADVINQEIRHANELALLAGIHAIPSVLINRKYRVGLSQVSSYERAVEVVGLLVDRELAGVPR